MRPWIGGAFVQLRAKCWIEGNGVRTIIVETASRFARDLMVQEVGHAKLRERGIDLIAADNPSSFIDDTPTAKLVRQVLGAISEFDKAMTVAKLRGARERKRREAGKCEGRKSHAERNPKLVALVRQLRGRRPKGGQRSLRDADPFRSAANPSAARLRPKRMRTRVRLPG
jgi:DNA invertase Pin-like site-specific DNA recombinase